MIGLVENVRKKDCKMCVREFMLGWVKNYKSERGEWIFSENR